MDNNGFVSDGFDTLKTLRRKERCLLGELHVAYRDRNDTEFLKVLRRTGYKSNQLDNESSPNNLWTLLCWKKFKTSRNLLFERDNDENLFEEILRTPRVGNSKFIYMIWIECELWRERDVLTATNSKGKQSLDYIIESNDDENLFAFLVFDFDHETESVKIANKNYFLTLKNDQYMKKTGETLFQKFYSLLDEQCEGICFDIMEKLLKEMHQIVDIKGETAIDTVLEMENVIYKHKMLELLMTYWKIYSKDYNHYKAILHELSPYFKLILTLKERHVSEFEELFPKYLESMQEKHGDRFECMVQKDLNSLLGFAFRHGQRRAISIIINCKFVDPNKVAIKTDESSFDSTTAHFIMSKLLAKGFYLGYGDAKRVPTDWISAQVFEDFLDSRVSEDGIHGCHIDYNFLINPEIREENMKTDYEDNEKLLFSRGIQSLENILNNERLKTSITHPVLSTFISLKSRKFRTIYNMNFFIYIFCFMVPTFLLTTTIPFENFYLEIFETYGELAMDKQDTQDFKEDYKIIGLNWHQIFGPLAQACICATIYLSLREAFQLFFISGSFKDHFKKKSNLFQIIIIALSCYLLYSDIDERITYIEIPSAFLIIFATVELLSILPYPSMSIYMFMLKQVTHTFMKFLTIFIFVIIAFAFSFCVILKTPNTIFRNFESPFTSFLKTLQMLSGEYTIDPYTLDSVADQLFFLIFVLTSFILFNLINGLAISDIALLRDHAEYLSLKEQIRNAAETEGVVCDIYWKVRGQLERGNVSSKLQLRNANWWVRFITYMISLFIRKYPYLHKMDKLCIDFKQKTVKYEQDQKRFDILRTRSGDRGRYNLEDETLKKLSDIVAKKQLQEESVSEKIESLATELRNLKTSVRSQQTEFGNLKTSIKSHQTEFGNLKTSIKSQQTELRSQHEDLKKLIQDCFQRT